MGKTIQKTLVTLTLITTILFSCKKGDNTDRSQSPKAAYRSSLLDYENVGTVHNNLLDHLSFSNDLDSTSSDSDIAASLTGRSFAYLRTDSGYTSYANDSLINVYNVTYGLANNLYGNGSATFSYAINLIRRLNLQELNYVNAANKVFDDAEQLAQNYRIDYVKDGLQSLISAYEKETWKDSEGDLAGGYLYTALHSINYWEGQISNPHFPPIYVKDPAQPMLGPFIVAVIAYATYIAQVDAAGYLYGWGRSYNSGETDPTVRINAGKATASEWSAAAGVGRFFK